MRKLLLPFVLLAFVFLSFRFIKTSITPSDSDITWTTDFAQALKDAKKDKKLLLVDFTGSDWCGWCIRLDNEVFSKEEFAKYAEKNLVLVKIDFPKRKAQSSEEKARNNKLAQKYGVQGLPTILLMDADEKVILQTGYQPGGPEAYIKHLEDARKN